LATIIINRHLWQLKLIRDLENANSEVEKSASVKEQFLANMSHEIRTPLNAIRGFIGLMLQTDLKKDQSEYASIISKASDNLLEIVNDILDISKIEAGELRLETKTFKLAEMMKMLELMFANSAFQKNLQFHWDISANTPACVEGDSDRLNQILMNLISNAVKFTNEGTISIKVDEMKREGLKSWIRFSVKDTGIGISEEKQSKIFERFYQVTDKDTAIQKGTGLGLAIVKSLVTLMGGEVSVISEPGKGSAFTVSIPFLINETMSSEPAETELPADRLKFAGVRLLIAEDNSVNQLLLKYLLRNHGIDPTFCENGRESLEMLQQENFDLLLLDIQMPVMNGYETIEKIRKFNKQLPVVAMTAYVMPGEKEKCLAAGMDEYLPKPFDNTALQRILIKFVNDKRILPDEEKENKKDGFVMGLVGGNKDMAEKILNQVRKELTIAVENIDQISSAGYNKDRIRSFCHHLISTISPLGIDTAAMAKIRQIQQDLAQLPANGRIESELDDLKNELQKLQQEVLLLA
jgi:CheY-like chemotaxis protein/nitrogen-specific signal transduction histidine kinase